MSIFFGLIFISNPFSRDPHSTVCYPLQVFLDTNSVTPFQLCCQRSCAGATEGIKHDAARWAYKPREVAQQGERFQGWMAVQMLFIILAVTVRATICVAYVFMA